MPKNFTNQEFIKKAMDIHGYLYDYSKVNYMNNKTKVEIICKEHGSFFQKPDDHLNGQGCSKCATKITSGEEEVVQWISSFNHRIIQSYKGWCVSRPQLEIDIYIPNLKLGIEFHGAYWHSSKHNDNHKKHQEKMLLAAEAGIHLIQIYDFEWGDSKKREKIKKTIENIIVGNNQPVIYARKTKFVKDINYEKFLNENHIHGFRSGPWKCSLVHDGEVVAVMICNMRSRKNGIWEITRFATSKKVVGAFSKLFKKFVKDMNPNEVISFADARFWTGCSYRRAGFVIDTLTNPNYCYIDKNGWFIGSRQMFQKHKLFWRLEKFDPDLTEKENCAMNGYHQLHDAGNWKWIWRKAK